MDEHREGHMALKKVFISFDWDNDRNYRNLLSAFSANPANDIVFEDSTPGEIDTSDVGRVKAVLTTKIRGATHTLVLIVEAIRRAARARKPYAYPFHGPWLKNQLTTKLPAGVEVTAPIPLNRMIRARLNVRQ
jgi:hypothetical protein